MTSAQISYFENLNDDVFEIPNSKLYETKPITFFTVAQPPIEYRGIKFSPKYYDFSYEYSGEFTKNENKPVKGKTKRFMD